MKKLFTFLIFLAFSFAGKAQTTLPSFVSFCMTGNVKASVSGLLSTNTLQGSYPHCTVSVYLAGTTTLATISSNSTGTSKANPFTANGDGSYSFFAASGYYDVKMSGGDNGGFPTPGFFTLPSITLGGTGGGGGGGGTILGSLNANQGVGTPNAANTVAPVAEVNYTTTSGNTAFACQEDQNKGVWDVRCNRNGVTWASNPSQAMINTIQAAKCYQFTQGGPTPLVVVPGGNAHIGGNISLPPGLDLEGIGGTQYGNLSVMTTTDPTQPMFTQQGSQTFICNGTPFTANSGTSSVGNLQLVGNGASNFHDVGLMNATGGTTNAYVHNITFVGFGGPGYTFSGNGQNSRGEYMLSISNLQWYMFSGAYNPSGFTDSNFHCALELGELDSRWDHVESTLFQADSGYYNRFFLCNVGIGGGGQDSALTNAYLQFGPHNVVVYDSANGGQRVSNNRLDASWWDDVHVGSSTLVGDNSFQGACTSPTLNPANFGSNPGGISTDPQCAFIKIFQPFGLGSTIRDNSYGTGFFPAWPVWDAWSSPNTLNGSTTTFKEPTLFPGTIGGQIGGDSGAGNVGADVFRNAHQTSSGNHANVGPTIHFNGFAHTYLADTVTTNYTNVDGVWPDAFVTVNFSGTFLGNFDTITPSAKISTCSGAAITSGIHWFYTVDGTFLIEMCPSTSGGGGGGTIGGSGTVGKVPLWVTNSTTLGNSHLDETTNTNADTFSQPVYIADGTAFGGGHKFTEGNVPTGAFAPAAGTDVTYGDVVAHWMLFNPNNTSWYAYLGVLNSAPMTSGNCVQATGPYTVASTANPCGTGGGGSLGYFVATAAAPAAASQTVLQQVGGVGRIQAYSANNTAVGSFSIVLTTADGTSIQAFPIQCTSTGCVYNTPSMYTASIRPNSTITTVACSTSGQVTFAQPFAGLAYRSVTAHLAACVGTAAYTYPNGFTFTPFQSGNALGAVSSATTTVLSINAASSTTGFVKLEEQD